MATKNNPQTNIARILMAAVLITSGLVSIVSSPAGAVSAELEDPLKCGPMIIDEKGRYCVTVNGFEKLFSHYNGKFLGYIHAGEDPKVLDEDPFNSNGNDDGNALGADCGQNGSDPDPCSQGNGYAEGARQPHCVTSDSPHPDYYAQVVYVRYKTQTDTYAQNKPMIQQVIREINGLMWDTTSALGQTLQYKVKCDSEGEIDVADAVLPNACPNADCFTDISSQLNNIGYNDPKVKYWVWTEDTRCGCGGKGNMYPDQTQGFSNKNNGNVGTPMYAVTFHGSTGIRVMMHENGHNMGAVQDQPNGANGANNKGHCWDGTDIMCYGESGEAKPYDPNVCQNGSRWDCNNDSYCHPKPAFGTYLADNWNVCTTQNRYLVVGNSLPTLVTDEYVMKEDPGKVMLDVTANDFDTDGDDLYFVELTQPSSGGTAVWKNGQIEYEPFAHFNGVDQFTYRMRDRQDPDDDQAMTGTGLVSVTVTPINDAPVADGLKEETNEEESVELKLTATDVEASPLSYVITQAPKYGTLTGQLPTPTYTPDPNFYGQDIFKFKVNDGEIDSNEALVIVVVNPKNDPPTVGDDSFLTFQDITWDLDVMANDSPFPDDRFTGEEKIRITGAESTSGDSLVTDEGGQLQILGTGDDAFIRYTPLLGFNSKDSGVMDKFEYTVCDDSGTTGNPADELCTTATVEINVIKPDAAALPDEYQTSEDVPLKVNVLNGVLMTGVTIDGLEITDRVSEDINPGEEGDEIVALSAIPAADFERVTVNVVSTTSNGLLTMSEDGAFEYAPNVDFFGQDSFEYNFTYIDRAGQEKVSNTVTTTILVTPVNDPPIPDAITVETMEDAPIEIELTAFDVEDSLAIPPKELAFGLDGEAGSGRLAIDGTSVRYSPNSEFSGRDSFVYTVTDSEGAVSTGTVTVNVRPVNDAPLAKPDDYTVRPETRTRILAELGVLDNDFDPDGDRMFAQAVIEPTNGALNLRGDGSFTYTANAGFQGIDTWTYIVKDETGLASYAVPVTMTVAENQLPTAAFAVERDTFQVGEIIFFEQLSSDPDGILTDFAWDFGDGATSDSGSGIHAYEVAGQFTVHLTVTDADGATDTVSRMLTITNDYGLALGGEYAGPAPVADAGDSITVLEGDSVILVGSSDNDVLTWQWVQNGGDPVDLQDKDTRNPYFTAPTLEEGEAKRILTFSLTVFDGYQKSEPASMQVTVTSEEEAAKLVVDGGPNKVAFGGQEVVMVATSDDIKSKYTWKQVNGAPVTMSQRDGVAVFTAPFSSVEQNLAFTVVADNGELVSIPDVVEVTILAGQAPQGIEAADTGLDVQFMPMEAVSPADTLGYAWDFGDGATSTERAPTHTYASPDTYDVTLTVTSKQGYETTYESEVVVEEAKADPNVVASEEASNPVVTVLLAIALVGILGAAGFAFARVLRRT